LTPPTNLTNFLIMAAAFLIVFTMFIAGMVVIVLGFRGTPVFAAPRCARCSYDLRAMNFMAAGAIACPECGSDLRGDRAVTYARLERRPKTIIIGAVLVGLGILMFVFVPLLLLRRSMAVGIGPQASQARSTPALIASLSNTMNQPWDWQELERRLGAGSLTTSDVDAALNVTIGDLNAKRASGMRQQPMHHLDSFLRLAMRRGDVSPAVLQSLCQAYYGPTPRIKSRSRAREAEPFEIEIDAEGPWNLPGMQGVWALRQVAADDGSVVSMISSYNERAPLASHPDRISGTNSGIDVRAKLAHKLPPGEHELTFTFDNGTVPEAGMMRGLDGKPGTAEKWPNPFTTWQATFKQKITIVPADQSIIELVTDPALNPLQKGTFGVQEAGARPSSQGVEIAITWSRASDADPPLSYRVTVIAGDQKIDFGSIFTGKTEYNSSTSSMGSPRSIRSLPPDVKSIDILLTPDPKSAERFVGVERIWGVEHKIENVKLERFDLQPTK
jgi:hypothetical protein